MVLAAPAFAHFGLGHMGAGFGRMGLGARLGLTALRDEIGLATIDLDFEHSRYWFNGALYTSIAALNAVTPITDNGDGTYTLGPVNNVPFAGYNAAQATVVCEYIKTGTTASTFAWTIQQSGDNTKYFRGLTLDGGSRSSMDVFRAGVAQAAMVSPVGATQQQNYRLRNAYVQKLNDFSWHCNGELMGTDTSGDVSDAATNVSVMIGHRAGANKIDGTVYRWAYFPRAVSTTQRYLLSCRSPAIAPGAWTFFNDPRGIKIGSDVYAGGVSQQRGQFLVGKRGAEPFTLGTTPLERDDHDNAAFLRRSSDGRIIAHYSKHAADNFHYQRISTNPDDMTAWGAETEIAAGIGATVCSYAQLVEITEGIFCFFRCISGALLYHTWHYTKSTDGGATWSAVQQLWNENNQRSYSQVAKTGANRIDIIFNNGHPDEYVGNSTYHAYYEAGAWKKSDGSALVLPAIPSTDLNGTISRVWNGTGGIESWVWGVGFMTGPNPVVVYATFPSRVNDHRYRYARWSGSAWFDHEVCTAGGSLYDEVSGADGSSGTTYQDFYSGGICVDDANPNIIYCSRPTKPDGSIGVGGPLGATRGVFQIWKGVTADFGLTWTMTQLTFGTEDCFRPSKVQGSNVVVFVTGRYVKFINYQTRISSITV